MNRSTRIIISFVFLGALFLFGKGVFAYQSPGKPTGLVNDFANVLSADQKSALEIKLENFRNTTSNEISVVTVPTLNDTPIEDYANTLFREWGIGSKQNNNGVLILAAINDHQLRIEVGYGLEGALPDLLTQQIQQDEMLPSFKAGDYATGLNKGADAVMAATQGEYQVQQSTSTGGLEKLPSSLILFAIFVIFQILFSILAPTKSWWLGGVFGGVIGVLLGIFLLASLWAILTGAIGIVLGLIFDYLVSRSYKKGTGTGGGFGGFWGGFGGGGSSGGFGGFGGGSSGGGGSSSSW